MKKKIIYTLITALAFASCEKTVVVQPMAFISPTQALGTLTGLQNIMVSAYDRLQDFNTYYGNAYTLLGDVQSDNIYTNTAITAGGNRYLSNNLNTAGSTYTFWSFSYLAINDCNLILANVDKVGGSDAAKNQLRGEAYAMRGLMYFDLARAYCWEPGKVPTTGPDAGWRQGVPLRLVPSTDPVTAGPIKRSTIDETYAQIESDLKQGVSLLAVGTSAASRTRLNKGAAAALLARTYLYWEKYPEAVAQCDVALANTGATLAGPGQYTTIFTSGSATTAGVESLFELTYNSNLEITGVTGSNNTLYSYTHPIGYNGLNTFGAQNVSDELFAALTAANDDRLSEVFQYGASNTIPAPLYNWSDKYNGKEAGVGTYTDGIKIIRYAEVLLIKAEALAAQGQYGPAATIITQLHTARNNVQAVPTTAAIVDYIKNERRIELYFEGSRFFDLKRWGQGISKPSKTAVGLIAADDYRLIAPLPLAEVNNSNGLVPQNPKY
jgi:hypothetical protein